MPLRNCLAAALVLPLALGATAQAQSDALLEELVRTSPLLNAAAAQADAARSDLWAARGRWLPQMSVEAAATSLDETLRIDGIPGSLTATRSPRTAQAIVDQAVFTSGRLGGTIGAAKARANEADHQFDAARQDLVFRGVLTISDVVRDRAILAERRKNEDIVADRLTESQARRKVGLATVTDIRQSEARLAGAKAERIAAEAALAASEAAFEEVFGQPTPAGLDLPAAQTALPDSLETSVERALSRNPDIRAQSDNAQAARQAVMSERSATLPQISLNATAGYIDNERFGIELGEAEQYTVSVQGRWNFFAGGTGHNTTRAAKSRASAARDLLQNTERSVRSQTIAAWSQVLAARAGLAAREAQALAASTAAEGVAAEARSGRRTRIDVLDADREKTEADVALIAARRDLVVAEFSLLRAVGAL